VLRSLQRAARVRPYGQRELCVHLAYGEDLELRLLVPDKLDQAVATISAAIRRPTRSG
jgi:hypothetical protein